MLCGGGGEHEEVSDRFERCNLDILAVCDTKLKERGEVMFGRMKETSGVMTRKRGKQGVGILKENKRWKCVKEVSTRR